MKTSKEIEGVLKCDIRKKYEYFIKKVVDSEQVWALRDEEGWATLGDDDREFIPLWPKKEFSDLHISGEWENYFSEAIDLDEFIDGWLPGLEQDKIYLTLMWHDGVGIELPWANLRHDLKLEMENY